jgi:glycerol kinase
MTSYILSIDQGTTSCRAIVFSLTGEVLGTGQKEFTQYFPHSGWVEHDANEILEKQIECIKEAIKVANVAASQIACVGLTNQRETTVVWNKTTGEPICPAIVWQCRRTANIVEKLVKKKAKSGSNFADIIRERTGLIADAYFSGTKIQWILENVDGARKLADAGQLSFGTIDSWLIYKLTEERRHVTEASNASRTMLFDINKLDWDDELLDAMNIPRAMMPEVIESDGLFGYTNNKLLGFCAPLQAVLGDQQAALFGQGCLEPGMFKCTYGTGSFLLGNVGIEKKIVNGLLTTIAWHLKGQRQVYAIEGASFMGGATLQWLRDELNIIESSAQSEELAKSLNSNEGVYLVPAHVGLGSPWWNPHVRGTILGLSRETNKAHIARAGLESIAYQIKDIAYEMNLAGVNMHELRVDGGVSQNNWLMQFQADLLGIPVKRNERTEATAWGVGLLAAVSTELVNISESGNILKESVTFSPSINKNAEYEHWRQAVKSALTFAAG